MRGLYNSNSNFIPDWLCIYFGYTGCFTDLSSAIWAVLMSFTLNRIITTENEL